MFKLPTIFQASIIVRICYVLLAGLICWTCIGLAATKPIFSVIKNEDGISISERGKTVFFYQRKPKLSGGKYYFNNYLHPVFDLQGDTLTEEFPADHFHHRGIFWAWHQIYVNDKNIGDSWVMENISQDVVNAETKLKGKEVRLETKVLWKSAAFQNAQPFIEESTNIIVHQQQSNIRKIDFEIALKALVPGILIGGSADEKGYGGFCARIKMPPGLVFTSNNGNVTPIEGQVKAGPWMDFSANGNGMTILCHPSTPNYPAPWILRQTGSMQNIVFPGAGKIEITQGHPIKLRYRIIIHNGNAKSLDLPALQAEYEKE